jgi:hypothetical protein
MSSGAATLEDLLSQLSGKRQEQWAAIDRLNATARDYQVAGQLVQEITQEMEKLSERVMDTVSAITMPDGEQPFADRKVVHLAQRAVADAADIAARAKRGTSATQVAAATIEKAHHPFEDARRARLEAAKFGLAQAILRGDNE